MKPQFWLVAAAMISAGSAQAADTYIGLDIAKAEYQESGMSSAVEPKVIQVKLGLQADKNLGMEFRLGTGLSEGTGSNIGISTPLGSVKASRVDVSLDLLLGVYGKASLPVNDSFEIYGMAGLTAVETTADVTIAGMTGSATTNGTEFSYGAGFAFRPNEKTTLTTEYAMLVDNGEVQISSLALGFALKF